MYNEISSKSQKVPDIYYVQDRTHIGFKMPDGHIITVHIETNGNLILYSDGGRKLDFTDEGSGGYKAKPQNG